MTPEFASSYLKVDASKIYELAERGVLNKGANGIQMNSLFHLKRFQIIQRERSKKRYEQDYSEKTDLNNL